MLLQISSLHFLVPPFKKMCFVTTCGIGTLAVHHSHFCFSIKFKQHLLKCSVAVILLHFPQIFLPLVNSVCKRRSCQQKIPYIHVCLKLFGNFIFIELLTRFKILHSLSFIDFLNILHYGLAPKVAFKKLNVSLILFCLITYLIVFTKEVEYVYLNICLLSLIIFLGYF